MKLKIFTISIILFLLIGCSLINGPDKKAPISFDDYSYPLAYGNMWTYNKTTTINNVQPDTFGFKYPQTWQEPNIVKLTDTSSNGVYLISSYYFDSIKGSGYGMGVYYQQTEDGLYQLSNTPWEHGIPVSNNSIEHEYNDPTKIVSKQLIDNSINSFSRLSLKYPIKLNHPWMYYSSGNYSIAIKREVIRYDVLQAFNREYDCFVVEWIYYYSNTSVFDYYSEIGLMKRIILNKNVVDTLETKIFTYDKREEYNLVKVILNR